MHTTRLLTFGLLCLSLAACTQDKGGGSTPAAGGAPSTPPAAAAPPPAAPPPAQPAAAAQPPAEAQKAAPTQDAGTSAAEQPASTATSTPTSTPWTDKALAGQELFAKMETNQGTIVLRLFSKDAPKTVANFVGLASGEREWTDPRTGQRTKRPLYDGTIFHRVIKDFMIQGGDPLGSGMGDPGYRFADEFQSGRGFDKVGLLAMANAGPNTNGSQFFITTSTPTYLNNRHTIFGEVVKGYDVVVRISSVPRGARDRPVTDVVVKKVTISDKQP